MAAIGQRRNVGSNRSPAAGAFTRNFAPICMASSWKYPPEGGGLFRALDLDQINYS